MTVEAEVDFHGSPWEEEEEERDRDLESNS